MLSLCVCSQVAERDAAASLLEQAGDHLVDHLLHLAHGVLLTGGNVDIHPSVYGEKPTGRLDRIEPKRTDTEMALARKALELEIPILGVCGGMQVLAVADGGTLIQDIPPPSKDAPQMIAHEQPTDPCTPWHDVRISSPASHWLGDKLAVNSTHHQSVRNTGAQLTCCGWADDGVVEVIASTNPRHFVLGVQWHPERMGDMAPYNALKNAAIAYQKRCA